MLTKRNEFLQNEKSLNMSREKVFHASLVSWKASSADKKRDLSPLASSRVGFYSDVSRRNGETPQPAASVRFANCRERKCRNARDSRQ